MGAVLGSVAVGGGEVLFRFEVGDCNQNQNGQRDDQQGKGVVFGQGGKAEKGAQGYDVEGREAGEVG